MGNTPWHLSQLAPADTKQRRAKLSSSVSREGKLLSSASPPLSGTFLTKQLQEEGHDHNPEPCCAFANVTKGFDTAINYK